MTIIETYNDLLTSNMTVDEKIEYYMNKAKLTQMDYHDYCEKIRELTKEKEGKWVF